MNRSPPLPYLFGALLGAGLCLTTARALLGLTPPLATAVALFEVLLLLPASEVFARRGGGEGGWTLLRPMALAAIFSSLALLAGGAVLVASLLLPLSEALLGTLLAGGFLLTGVFSLLLFGLLARRPNPHSGPSTATSNSATTGR